MNLTQFNFAHPSFLWALLIAPALWFVWRLKRAPSRTRKLDAFVDPELLPHLLKGYGRTSRTSGPLLLWSLVWAFAVLALAGPRWSFTEVEAYKPQKDLVVALDLSRSMDSQDVKPSRLARAKERIADFVNENPDVKVGLIGFAGDAHMITPVTEDRGTIDHLLPALQTDLITVPGRDLNKVLNLAKSMLASDPSAEKGILVLSDATQLPQATTNHGIRTTYMNFYNSPGHAATLAELFAQSSFSARAQTEGVSVKDWEPRFYIFLFPALLLSLFFFRRRKEAFARASSLKVAASLFAALMFLPQAKAHADSEGVKDLFFNRELQGKNAFEARDFKKAEEKLEDPYRKGVAQYREGKYAAAAESFAKSQRAGVAADSRYNLGNALAEQGQYQEAIAAYKEALKSRPGFENARKNLKIVEDLLKKKPPQSQNSQNQSKPQNSQANKGGGQKPDPASQQNPTQAQKRAGHPEPAKPEGSQPGEQANAQPKPSQPGAEAKNEGHQAPAKAPGEQSQRSQNDDQKEAKKYARDVDANQWLNLVRNDPHAFLKNQFMIESARERAQNEEQ